MAPSEVPNFLVVVKMKVDLFDFELPNDAIALRPASPRDHARLLQVADNGNVSDHNVYNLPELLEAGDILVLNNTRVLPAALIGTRPARAHGGGSDVKIDVNLHKQISGRQWKAFIRPAKRLKAGDDVHFSPSLKANVLADPDHGECVLEFNHSDQDLLEAIEGLGAPPLPPYIARQRAVDDRDVIDYQTIYAKDTGSVAAPTAGLHFTDALFEALSNKGVEILYVTLHVGAGTFLPVKSDDTKDHDMHSEWFTLDADTATRINKAKSEGKRVVAVGTTSLRALESAAKDGKIDAVSGETDIFITPGYDFQMVDGLMTNFHLPKSTLFMLVSAMCGLGPMQAAYRHAIDTGYRFYSYGDSSLLWKMR